MSEILKIQNLVKHYKVEEGFFIKEKKSVKAVQNVTLEIKKGETLGLVGESGCGKSTLGKCLIRLVEPTSGTITFSGKNITSLNPHDMREMRKKMQIIFQDPYSSLNPRMSVASIISEPLEIHGLCENKNERKNRVRNLMNLVGLPEEALKKYPHEFSGGQRQRIGIARALAVDPEFIVCDEPVSALDVSIQAQIINLLMELQKKFDLTYLFIAHDLKVVEHISNRIAVMYLGKLVEIANSDLLYSQAKHPYTQALLSAIPVPKPGLDKKRIILKGDIPSPFNPPNGCQFHPRCPQAFDKCKTQAPELTELKSKNVSHKFSCWL